MHWDLNVYCAPFSLPEDTQSHSSNPIRFKKSKIWRGSSLGASSELFFYADRGVLLSWLILYLPHFIIWCLGISSSVPENLQSTSSIIPSLWICPLGGSMPRQTLRAKTHANFGYSTVYPTSVLPEFCSLFCLHLLTHLKHSNLSILFIFRSLFESSEHLCVW